MIYTNEQLAPEHINRLQQIAGEPDGKTWTGLLPPYHIIALQAAGAIECLGIEPGSREPGKNLADGVMWQITPAGRNLLSTSDARAPSVEEGKHG